MAVSFPPPSGNTPNSRITQQQLREQVVADIRIHGVVSDNLVDGHGLSTLAAGDQSSNVYLNQRGFQRVRDTINSNTQGGWGRPGRSMTLQEAAALQRAMNSLNREPGTTGTWNPDTQILTIPSRNDADLHLND